MAVVASRSISLRVSEGERARLDAKEEAKEEERKRPRNTERQAMVARSRGRVPEQSNSQEGRSTPVPSSPIGRRAPFSASGLFVPGSALGTSPRGVCVCTVRYVTAIKGDQTNGVRRSGFTAKPKSRTCEPPKAPAEAFLPGFRGIGRSKQNRQEGFLSSSSIKQ